MSTDLLERGPTGMLIGHVLNDLWSYLPILY